MKVVRLGGERVTVSTAAGTVVLDRPSLATAVPAGDAAPGRPAPVAPAELAEVSFAASNGAAPSSDGELKKEAGECARWGYWDLAADGTSSGTGPAATWAANERLAATLAQVADRTKAMRQLTRSAGAAQAVSVSPGTGSGGGCPT
jgi:hypothetical protein